ncbi:MAG: hypothetical protein C4521_02880 [Actinobacteria bacterium]|nr:MAG: hypothetical protein C4521_02880 [Actinomycetota bacterium]
MGLHREIEKMLEQPNDTLLLREILAFWSGHRSEKVTAAQLSATLHRGAAHVERLLNQLVALAVLDKSNGSKEPVYSYRLRGAEAIEVEGFARSKRFHEQKLIRSTDRFRSIYQRRGDG